VNTNKLTIRAWHWTLS